MAAELHLAAGAEEVWTPLPGAGPLRSRADARRLPGGRWTGRDLKLSAHHPLGTARMGSDHRRSVVDGHGRVHGIGGLAVVDASALPGSPGVNPQVTIMALATRSARRLAEDLA
jgi:choline dehydrogenase-like flavoprotein